MPRTFRFSLLLPLTLAILLVGCGGGGTDTAVTITPGERSPAIEGAQARFAVLQDSMVVEDSSVAVTVTAESFEAGVQTETPRAEELANSANGQHAHIIVDNGPYMANYALGEPFDVGQLAPGPHTAFVFPSRSYHESVKSDSAYDVVNFFVAGEDGSFPMGEFMMDPSAPNIIYSRPKGTYSGDGAERILLDFYLINAQLSADGYKARYTIRPADGQESIASITLTEWTPAFVTGLESGTYVFQLELLDGDGNVVPGAFNTTEREITVERGGDA